jgi:hypothetical protein
VERILATFVASVLGGIAAFPVTLFSVSVLLLPARQLLRFVGVRFNEDDDFDPPSMWLIGVGIGLAVGIGVASAVLFVGDSLFPAEPLGTSALVGGVVATLTGTHLGRHGFPGLNAFAFVVPAGVAGGLAAAVAAVLL